MERLRLEQRADVAHRLVDVANTRPSNVQVPSPRSRPSISRMVVDLPAPFGPRKPVTVPGRTSNDSPDTAGLPP